LFRIFLYILVNSKQNGCHTEGDTCGGKERIECCPDRHLVCSLNGDYEDASGRCVKTCFDEPRRCKSDKDCCEGLKCTKTCGRCYPP
jgi:hypothetical protein